MKYVVLARDNANDGCICDSFGVFSSYRNAQKRLSETEDSNPNIEYCIEEVDEHGSFANDRCVDN